MILADAHVHIYDCFDLPIFLDSALANFANIADHIGQHYDFTFLLFLTDWSRQTWFKHISGYVNREAGGENYSLGNWCVHATKEKVSLMAQHKNGRHLFLIAGRKIITGEDLELLALGTEKAYVEGAPIEELIISVSESGAIPVIPWAPGKWMGRRGMIVRNVLEKADKLDFFLCDNGNRPTLWPRPFYFQVAEEKGRQILSGSDPLPFASEMRRAGSFGFSIQRSLDPENPLTSIKQMLLDPLTKIQAYGALGNPLRFFRNQVAMQLMKRLHIRKWAHS